MKIIRGLVLCGLFYLPVASANAQIDARVAPQAIAVLQAQLAYFEAMAKAKDEDAKKIAEWWAQYVKGTEK